MPSALVAPARPHVRHEEVPAARFDAEGRRVAIRATVSLGDDEVEEDRRRDSPKDEEAHEDEREENRVSHSGVQLVGEEFDHPFLAIEARAQRREAAHEANMTTEFVHLDV